jgi:hypothetical protein
MKQQFNGTYTFTPSSGVVTLNNINIPLERLYLIVNTTRNTPIFNFAVSGLGATRTFNSPNTSFDVAFDTSTHSSTDSLAIIYDDGVLDGSGNQTVNLVNASGTTAATFKGASTPAAAADTSLVVALNPNTSARIGDGANNVAIKAASTSAVAADTSLVVGLSPNSNVVRVENNGNVPLPIAIANSNNTVQAVLRGATEALAPNNMCLAVKSVNVVRLSGDTLIEERRPDSYSDTTRREFLNLANGVTATVYQRSSSARRIRLVQIMLGWNYASNPDGVNQYGRFQLEFWNDAGAWVENLFTARLQSGQLHRLDFNYGVLSPAVGGSIRINNQTPGTPINLNWFATVWEE